MAMASVLGIGGVFFKSSDPAKLAAWYERWLNLDIESSFGGTAFLPSRLPEKARVVWAPFPESTTYFDPSSKPFMINLIVDDVATALRQVGEGGAQVVGEPETVENGTFGWFIDPEGNKVELWQPK